MLSFGAWAAEYFLKVIAMDNQCEKRCLPQGMGDTDHIRKNVFPAVQGLNLSPRQPCAAFIRCPPSPPDKYGLPISLPGPNEEPLSGRCPSYQAQSYQSDRENFLSQFHEYAMIDINKPRFCRAAGSSPNNLRSFLTYKLYMYIYICVSNFRS